MTTQRFRFVPLSSFNVLLDHLKAKVVAAAAPVAVTLALMRHAHEEGAEPFPAVLASVQASLDNAVAAELFGLADLYVRLLM